MPSDQLKQNRLEQSRLVSMIAIVLCLVIGCESQSTKSGTKRTQVIGAEETILLLDAPGLESNPAFVQRVEQGLEVREIGHWPPVSGRWPEAYLGMTRLSDAAPSHMLYTKPDLTSGFIEKLFPGESLKLGRRGTASNRVGELEFYRFTKSSGAECVFILQGFSTFSDQLDLNSAAEPLGDILVFGWYCLESKSAGAESSFRGFMHGIGLRDFAAP